MPKIKEGVEKIISANEGKFLEKETEEKRKLSYKIGQETHGIYIARRFELENGESLKEINSKLNLDGGVLRFIISRTDELPALLSKEERIAQSQKKTREVERTEKMIPEKPKELKKEIPKKETEEKSAKSEDIDKKLEEILNI
jgi:ribosomal protein S6